VGDQVLAIGNPFGVGQTVTGGIISALARTDVGISDFASFIQTDAAINPGNSGGALVDMNGDLVGVNTAIFSRSGASAGVGFAVPSEMVRRVVESALAEGRVVRAWAGARGQTVDSEMARTLGLQRPGGVLIAELFPDGPLERAGLRRGDVVVGLGGREIVDENGLRFEAATKRPGEETDVVFLRQGARQTARARLAAPPDTPARAETTLEGRHSFDGVRVATLNPALAEELGVDPMAKGVVVIAVDRAREGGRAGFRPGDIILQIDNEPVGASGDLVRLVRGVGRQGQVTLVREGRQLNAVLLL
jgi:S1-C subfamily serine protease